MPAWMVVIAITARMGGVPSSIFDGTHHKITSTTTTPSMPSRVARLAALFESTSTPPPRVHNNEKASDPPKLSSTLTSTMNRSTTKAAGSSIRPSMGRSPHASTNHTPPSTNHSASTPQGIANDPGGRGTPLSSSSSSSSPSGHKAPKSPLSHKLTLKERMRMLQEAQNPGSSTKPFSQQNHRVPTKIAAVSASSGPSSGQTTTTTTSQRPHTPSQSHDHTKSPMTVSAPHVHQAFPTKRPAESTLKRAATSTLKPSGTFPTKSSPPQNPTTLHSSFKSTLSVKERLKTFENAPSHSNSTKVENKPPRPPTQPHKRTAYIHPAPTTRASQQHSAPKPNSDKPKSSTQSPSSRPSITPQNKPLSIKDRMKMLGMSSHTTTTTTTTTVQNSVTTPSPRGTKPSMVRFQHTQDKSPASTHPPKSSPRPDDATQEERRQHEKLALHSRRVKRKRHTVAMTQFALPPQ